MFHAFLLCTFSIKNALSSLSLPQPLQLLQSTRLFSHTCRPILVTLSPRLFSIFQPAVLCFRAPPALKSANALAVLRYCHPFHVVTGNRRNYLSCSFSESFGLWKQQHGSRCFIYYFFLCQSKNWFIIADICGQQFSNLSRKERSPFLRHKIAEGWIQEERFV